MEPPELIDAIYEAAFIPEQWGAVLERLRITSGSASGSILVFDGRSPPKWKSTSRTQDVLARFASTGAWQTSERDPVKLLAATTDDQYFHCLSDLMTPEQLARDPTQQLLEEAGVAWQIGTAIPMPTREHVVFTFERDLEDGRHDAASVSRLSLLRPHLARAGMMTARLGIERARGALEAITGLGLPAALLDRLGRVRDTNALMTSDLISTGSGGRALLGTPVGDAFLGKILAGQSTARSIAFPPTANRPGRVAHLISVSGAAQDILGSGFWLLVMNLSGGTRRQPDLGILRALFDLSPAESRLAAALASGNDLARSAQACGIRTSTARSYLEQIFRKTGVHRQAELIGLILGSVGPPA